MATFVKYLPLNTVTGKRMTCFEGNFDVPTFQQLRGREVVAIVRYCYENSRDEFDAPRVGRDGFTWSWMDAICEVEKECGMHPHLQYLKACWHGKRQSEYRARGIKRAQHAENQRVWFEEGGQVEAYFRKYPYGGDHAWFLRMIEKKTGMDCKYHTVMDVCLPDEVQQGDEVKDFIEHVQKPCFYCRRRNCGEICDWLCRPLERPVEEFTPPTRSVMLLYKLRSWIRALRTHVASEVFGPGPIRPGYLEMTDLPTRRIFRPPAPRTLENFVDVPLEFEPQMEDVSGEELMKIETSNVVLSEENPSAPAIASQTVDTNWQNKCSSDVGQNFNYLTNRYTYFKTFVWKTSDQQGAAINSGNAELPVDFVNTQVSSGNMAMFMPFKVHRYFSSDMHIKIHINSNKFQSGQLQFSWQYMEKYDIKPLASIYGRSQLPHVIVNAGSSNETELIIPYKFLNPYVSTKQRKNSLKALYFGTLKCMVISPLAVGDNVDLECNISYFISFPNCKFNGMRDGAIAEPEMMPVMAAMVASKAVDKLIGDSNCDNPTSKNVPNYLVPTASHSWSLGSGLVEPLHNLRLNAQAIGVGRNGIDNSETAVSIPCRTFGMINHIPWTANESSINKVGTCIWSCDAHPQLEKDKIWKINTLDDGLDAYQMPPVGVVSSLYQYWRGSLEFRFDIVCTQFHTGRLLLAYVPGAYGSMAVTLDQARNSPHVEFSLQDSASFTFVVPFISDKPWWWRKFAGPQRRADTTAPSRLYLFVLNPLIKIDAITDQVNIIPYVRAGVDFEVSVPVQPAIGLSYTQRNIIPNIDCAYAFDGYWPWYVTYDSAVFDGKKYCLQYSAVSAARFREPLKYKPNEYAVYGVNESDSVTVKWSTAVTSKVAFICLISSGEDYYYGIPFPKTDEARAVEFAKAWKEGRIEDAKGKAYNYIEKSEDSSKGNLCLKPKVYSDAVPKKKKFAEPQMEARYDAPNMLMPTNSLAPTGFGQYTFNENFSDMKDLMRRYQLYSTNVIKPKNSTLDAGEAICRFPVVPTGLNLDVSNPSPIWNSMREGALPIIMNGYIFFRGSIRFRVVLSNVNVKISPSCVWVQHHPDMPLDDYSLKQGQAITNKDKFKNHNYAYYIQTTNINNIIEFEVPFYQPSMYGFLRRTNAANRATELADFIGLGDIIIGLTNSHIVDSLQLDVYYSIGDDFSISTFRGFDPIVFCNEVFPEMADFENECPACYMFDCICLLGEEDCDCVCLPTDNSSVSSYEHVEFEPEMMLSAASSLIGGLFGTATSKALTTTTADLKKNAREFITHEVNAAAAPHINSIKNELNVAKEKISDDVYSWAKTQAITTAFGNLTHVLINPTPATIAVSVANILISLVSGSISVLTSLIEALTNLFNNHWGRFSGMFNMCGEPQSPEEELTPETRSIIAILFTGVCSLVGVTATQPKGYYPLMRDINMTACLSNNVITFLKNSSEAIASMIKYATSLLNPRAHLDNYLDQDLPTLKKWFEEVEYLTDARLKSKLAWDRRMCTRVFDAAHIGSLIVVEGIDKHLPGGKILWDSYKKITDLKNDMVERGVHPDVRYEPFSFWFAGGAGLGKSHLTSNFVNELARSINYTSDTPLCYNITPGLKHWSGVQHPFALVSDDMFQVGGENLQQELSNLFTIMSSCTLNPPMAAVEEKNKRLNPYVYVMHSNFDFPNLGNVMRHKEAVYRRRKMLIWVRLRPEIAAHYPNFVDASQLTPEHLGPRGEYSYLEFRIAVNPRDQQTEWSEYMPYVELRARATERFRAHHAREVENFTERMNMMYSLSPDYDPAAVFDQMPGVERQPISLQEQITRLRARVAEMRAELNDPRRQPGYTEQIGEYIRSWFPANPESPESAVVGYEYNVLDAHRFFEYLKNTVHNGDVAYSREEMTEVICRMRERFGMNDVGTHTEFWRTLVSIEPSFFRNFAAELNCTSADLLELSYYHLIVPEVIVTSDTAIPCYQPANVQIFSTFMNYFFPCDQFVTGMARELFWGHINLDISAVYDPYGVPEQRTSMVNNYSELAKYLRLNLYVQMNMNRRQNYFSFLSDSGAFRRRFACQDSMWNTVFDLCKRGMNYVFDREDDFETTLRNFERMFPGCTGCSCIRFLYQALASLEDLEYCPYSKKLIFTNSFGIRRVLDLDGNMCGDAGCPLKKRLVRSLLRVMYNNTNGVKPQIPVSFVNDPKEDFAVVYPTWEAMLKSWWKAYISPALGCVMDFLLYILPGALAAIAAFLVIKGYGYVKENMGSWFTGGSIPSAPEGSNYFKFDAPKAAPKINRPNIIPKFIPSTPQSLQTARPVMANAITENMVVLAASWVDNGERRLRQCTCLMLYCRKMLVLRHYMEEFSHSYKQAKDMKFTLYFQTSGQQCEQTLHANDLFGENCILWAEPENNVLKSNFGVINLPKETRMFKNILSKFATIDMHERVAGTVDMYCLGETTGTSLPVKIERNHSVIATETSSEVQLERVYVYSKQNKGLCGSVIVSNNLNAGAGAIIGIHVAGNSTGGWGMAEPIYREMFEEIRTVLPDRDVMPIPLLPVENAEIQLNSNVFAFGAVPKEYSHKESGKTKIVPSLVAGQIYPVRTEVNPLRPNDPRQPPGSHPLRDGCKKHGDGYIIPFDPKNVKRVEDNVSTMLYQVCRPVRAEVKPLTLQQAICGDPELPYFESLNWKSSEGFPLSKFRPASAHDKRWLFDLKEGKFGFELVKLDDKLVQQLKLRDEAFKKNVKPPTIYVDCLKDYRLSPEKCKIAGKTRIFSIAPVQCSIDIRMYINDFNAAFKNNRIRNSCGIGINPDSFEWTQLVHYLLEVGDKIITLDYTNFGPCLMSQLVASSANCITNWFKSNGASEEHVKRVEWLLDCDIINPVHLSGDLVYQTINGIASGSPLTGECNSIPNLYYMKLTYLEIMEDFMPNYATLFDFDQMVRLVVYGDDLIMSVNDKIIEHFNAVTIAESLKKHGIKVTSAQKDAELTPYGSLYDATFLKRSFKPHPTRSGIWLAPVEEKSVEECVNWIHACEDPVEATLENMRSSLDLAYGHGPEYYDAHRQKLIDGAVSIGGVLQSKSWYERDREIFDEPQQNLNNFKMECKLPGIWYSGV